MRKCILSYRVAKYLLEQGFHIVDIDTSHKISGNIVFIFEDTPELNEALAALPRPERYRKGI